MSKYFSFKNDEFYTSATDFWHLRGQLSFLGTLRRKINQLEIKPEDLKKSLKTPKSKRVIDLCIAIIGIIVLLPLFILIALAIKLESKGPIIYRSKRAGQGYRVFDFYKFRSMYVDANERLLALKHLNQYQENSKTIFFKIKEDPRITKIGRLLRKMSLDELPQLFNVILGNMSIVGNRPLPLYEAEELMTDEWIMRFLAPAGITGLWQVTKRGKDNMSSEERIQLDLKYAKEYNFWYDLKIMVKTLPAMIQHEEV